jgi:hypothetical protein
MRRYRLVEGVTSLGWRGRIQVKRFGIWWTFARFRKPDDARSAWALIKHIGGRVRVYEEMTL